MQSDEGEPEAFFRRILDELPTAIYTTDAAGHITYYNEEAAVLWGHGPPLGESEWCGSWRLFWPDGTPLAHADCPMALAIKEGRPIRGMEAVAERPDGTRVPFLPFPTPLFDATGQLTGAVNMLVDTSTTKDADAVARRLAAIVATSDDAIISRDLDGIITSWNAGAERLFGFTAEEALGRPIFMLVPEDREAEEQENLARLQRGEHIAQFETLRRRKDGELLEVSLTMSPLRDYAGRVVGASKIARDITERRRAAERQRLLLREMNHRVKNLFTLIAGLITLSARSATSAQELASSVRERITALAHAHDLTLPKDADARLNLRSTTTLHQLIAAILSPFGEELARGNRFAIVGPNITLSPRALTSFALLLHEFATNAAKNGALSEPTGHIAISCADGGDLFELAWTERGGPHIDGPPETEGFGGQLARMTLESRFRGPSSTTGMLRASPSMSQFREVPSTPDCYRCE